MSARRLGLARLALACAAALLSLAVVRAAESVSSPTAAEGVVEVVMQTELGEIRLALEQARAPITVGNFLRYVDARRFDGIEFYRAVRIDEEGEYGLVQGGLQGDPKKVFRPILHETTYATGLSHTKGAISMARGDPGSATADFFIVVGDLVALDGQPEGDQGYAVFGHVTQGMDIVRAILDRPRSAEASQEAMKGQMLSEPVKILTVRRASEAAGP